MERGVAQIDALEEAHEGLVERVENIRGAGADEVTLENAANHALQAMAEVFPDEAEYAQSLGEAIAEKFADGLAELTKLAPPPLNLALVPLGKSVKLVVGAVRRVRGNKEEATQLGKQVVDASRRVHELLACVKGVGPTATAMREEMDTLTQALEDAASFLGRFAERGFMKALLHGNLDARQFPKFDDAITKVRSARPPSLH